MKNICSLRSSRNYLSLLYTYSLMKNISKIFNYLLLASTYNQQNSQTSLNLTVHYVPGISPIYYKVQIKYKILNTSYQAFYNSTNFRPTN